MVLEVGGNSLPTHPSQTSCAILLHAGCWSGSNSTTKTIRIRQNEGEERKKSNKTEAVRLARLDRHNEIKLAAKHQ